MLGEFAVFILSHGRADRVYTVNALRKCGYTGKIYIIVDNEDNQVPLYKTNYGDENVIVFDKVVAMPDSDTMDNFRKHNIVLYERNSCFKIAKELGLDYFLELDDDYSNFCYRIPKNGKLLDYTCKNLDRLFEDIIQFLVDTDSLVVALSQGGDYLGGANGRYIWKGLSRKAMNSFFCRVDKPFKFLGTINEDTNMYITHGNRGDKIFSITQASLNQQETQSQEGGLTEIYLDVGTYVKSFYSVMAMPSCVKVAPTGSSHRRMHHSVDWTRCVPKIINEKYKKAKVLD